MSLRHSATSVAQPDVIVWPSGWLYQQQHLEHGSTAEAECLALLARASAQRRGRRPCLFRVSSMLHWTLMMEAVVAMLAR